MDDVADLPEELRARCDALKLRFDEEAGGMGLPAETVFTALEAYAREVLPTEVDRLRHVSRPPVGVELLVLLCGTSPQPLMVSASFVAAQRILLIGSDSGTGHQAVDQFEDWLQGVPQARGWSPRFSRSAPIHPTDPVAAYRTLTEEIREAMRTHGVARDQVLVDITGGKKTMIAAAFLVCSELGLRSAYVDAEYDPVVRVPRPCTATFRLLEDPVAAFRLREIGRARGLVKAGRFEAACELLDEAVKSRMVVDESAHLELQNVTTQCRAIRDWKEARYESAKESFEQSGRMPPPVVSQLAEKWSGEGDRLKRFARGRIELHAFISDRIEWARFVEGHDPRDAFLTAYSACEIALDGLLWWLGESKRLVVPGMKRKSGVWKDFERVIEPADLVEVLATGQLIGAGVSHAEFLGLGQPVRAFADREIIRHRNALVHKIETAREDLVERFLRSDDSIAVQLIGAVRSTMGVESPSLAVQETVRALHDALPVA